MIIHTTSASESQMGHKLEVMGNLQGFIDDETFIITDSYPLPVSATETRVNAGNESIEFTGTYNDLYGELGRKEVIVGWYHSHPGYGCWLSKIDIDTQTNLQNYQEPALAIVVDPVRTVSSSRVTIGAFRVWPPNYKPPESSREYVSIPKEKIEDFGVHYNLYYELDIEYFKSTTDTTLLNLLWNKYWINTLSSSPLLVNRNYINLSITDVSQKIDKVEGDIGKHSGYGFHISEGKKKSKRRNRIIKINKRCS